MTALQIQMIKTFLGLAQMNETKNVEILERDCTQAEIDVWNATREAATEVALGLRVGDFPGGAYRNTKLRGNIVKVPVRDPKGAQANFAKLIEIPAGMVRPIVNQAGDIMPGLCYKQSTADVKVLSTGTTQPSAMQEANAYEAEARLANASKLAEARKKAIDIAVAKEAKLVDLAPDTMADQILMSWGYTAEVVASVTI